MALRIKTFWERPGVWLSAWQSGSQESVLPACIMSRAFHSD